MRKSSPKTKNSLFYEKKNTWSLSKKALLGILAVLLPVIVTFLLVYNHNRVYLKNRVLDTLTIIAEAYEGHVYQFLEQSKRRVQDFASDGFIRNQLLRIIRGKTTSTDVLSRHLIKNKIVLDKTISTIHVLSLEGKVVASTNNAEIGRNYSDEPFFINGKNDISVEETYTLHAGLPEIVVSTPVCTKDTHRVIGVIANFIQISELDNILSGEYHRELGAISRGKGKGAWNTLEIYLVNRDKLMITKSLFIKDAVLKQAVDTLPVRLGFTSKKEMAGFYKDYRCIDVVGASMYIPSLQWVLLIEIDRDEVLAPIKNVLVSAGITGAVVIVMIASLLILFLKKVVKPLRIIAHASTDIARGNLDAAAITVKTNDEIGVLCKSFNVMSHDIKTRTSELMKINERLAEAQKIARMGNWEWDTAKNELYWSEEVYRIFGLTRKEFAASYEAFLECVHPDDLEYVKKSVADAIQGKKPYEIDHRILLKDNTMRVVHEKATVLFDDIGKVVRMVGTVQDITEWRHREEEMNLLQALILAVGEAENLHDALVITLEKVCNATGWIYGEAWTPHPGGKYLERDHAYYSKIDRLEKFSELSGEYRFSPGVGLPGRTWAEKQPVWIRDVSIDPNYPRAPLAKETGLKAGVAFPIMTDKDVVAIIVFYMSEPRERDEWLINLVSSATVQLGQVIQRKQAEEALQRSEALLHSILDNTTAVVYVKDLRGRYTFINKRFEDLFHIKKDEIKGKTDYDLWDAQMADAFRKNDKKVIKEKSPLEFDEIALHDDGKHAYISVKFPLFDSIGTVYAVCGISTDITERKQMEDQLRKLSCAIEQSPSVVIITDTNCSIQYVNPKFTQLTGYTPEEVFGKTPGILKSGMTPKEEYKRLWETLTAGNEWRGEFINRKKNGELYWEEACISPIRNHENIITNFVGVAEDITSVKQKEEERDKLREQLYHTQKLESIGQLAGGIAHDFNNILTAIIGYGNVIQLEMKEDDPLKDYVQKILFSAERASDLTRGILTFSRKQINNPTPVNLNEFINATESFLLRIIGEDVELRTLLSDKKCVVMADRGQLEQILMNLTANARDAMPDGGILTISTDVIQLDNDFVKAHGYGKPGTYAIIVFSDTGIGMDEKTRERIFEPFFTTKEVGKGTGIGLATVYGIVKQHNGFINVYSEQGKGATFRICLPVTESETEEIKSDTPVLPVHGNETILLAEDEEEIRHLVKMVLESAGYTVITAINGNDAIKKFKENCDTIQLLIFDVIMPVMSGKEAYDIIRKKAPGIKALFTSGYSKDMVEKKIILKEGLYFIPKPVSPSELLSKVREVLDK
ncbi:MAG: PAS domain S-box protein [Candidatus Kuenenia sp.]|nr:PAS domain S-box protein [Candidatus Kuenenia hertensis]